MIMHAAITVSPRRVPQNVTEAAAGSPRAPFSPVTSPPAVVRSPTSSSSSSSSSRTAEYEHYAKQEEQEESVAYHPAVVMDDLTLLNILSMHARAEREGAAAAGEAAAAAGGDPSDPTHGAPAHGRWPGALSLQSMSSNQMRLVGQHTTLVPVLKIVALCEAIVLGCLIVAMLRPASSFSFFCFVKSKTKQNKKTTGPSAMGESETESQKVNMKKQRWLRGCGSPWAALPWALPWAARDVAVDDGENNAEKTTKKDDGKDAPGNDCGQIQSLSPARIDCESLSPIAHSPSFDRLDNALANQLVGLLVINQVASSLVFPGVASELDPSAYFNAVTYHFMNLSLFLVNDVVGRCACDRWLASHLSLRCATWLTAARALILVPAIFCLARRDGSSTRVSLMELAVISAIAFSHGVAIQGTCAGASRAGGARGSDKVLVGYVAGAVGGLGAVLAMKELGWVPE